MAHGLMRLAPWAVVNRHQLKSWPMGPWALVFGFERRSSILAYTTLRFRRCVAVAGDNRSSDQLRRSSGEGDLVSSSQILAIFLFPRYARCVFVVEFLVLWVFLAAEMVAFCCLSMYASLLVQLDCFLLTLFWISMFQIA